MSVPRAPANVPIWSFDFDDILAPRVDQPYASARVQYTLSYSLPSLGCPISPHGNTFGSGSNKLPLRRSEPVILG